MMATINDYFEQAQLSSAAYADLWNGMSLTDFKDALVASGRISSFQADLFISKYAVVDQCIDPVSVFKGSDPFNYDNDYLIGGAGDDTIIAKFGNDVLDGGAGADRMEGNAGDDFIFGNDNGNCGMSKPYRTDKDIQFLFMEAA